MKIRMKIDTTELRALLNTTPAGQEFGLAPDVCHELLNEIERLREVVSTSPSQALDEIDRLRAALLVVLEHTAALVRPCRRCGEMLYFVRSGKDGRAGDAAFTAEGRNHFTDCTHAQKRAAQQEALFDAAPLPD